MAIALFASETSAQQQTPWPQVVAEAPESSSIGSGAQAAPVVAAPASHKEGREGSLLAELEMLDRRLSGAEQHVQVAEANRRQAEATLASAQAATAAARLSYAEVAARYGRRLGVAMRAGDGARWALLGGSHNLSAWVDHQRLLAAVAALDFRLFEAVRGRKKALETQLADSDVARAQLQAAEAARRSLRDNIAQRRRSRSERLRALRRDRAARLTLHLEQVQARQALGAQLREAPGVPLLGSDFAARRGRLPWPAEGRVRRHFGERVELTFGTVTAHNGLDIAAPAGAGVQALARGKVVYADWLRGFGQTVIVEHGGGYHAVFAHLARTQVRRGEQVCAGQQLGAVGDTGSLRGTVLYFEIRRHGVAQDPKPWLDASG